MIGSRYILEVPGHQYYQCIWNVVIPGSFSYHLQGLCGEGPAEECPDRLTNRQTIGAFILYFRALFGVFQAMQEDNVCIDMLLVCCEHHLGAI